MVTWFSVTWYWQDGRPSNVVDIRCSAVNVCPSRCDIYARSAMVSVLPPGIVVRRLQRSHSELSRVDPLSGLPSRLFFGLPTRFTYPVFNVFTQTLSDLDWSKVRSDKLLCVNTALIFPRSTNAMLHVSANCHWNCDAALYIVNYSIDWFLVKWLIIALSYCVWWLPWLHD